MEVSLWLLVGALVGASLVYLWGIRPAEARLRALEAENKGLREEATRLQATKAMLETDLPKSIDLVKSELRAQAQQAVQQQREALLKGNTQQLGDVLKPLREEMEKFRAQIERNSSRASVYQGRLEEQIKAMYEKTQTLSADAKALTEALRGENKAQGQWGEVVLARLLEVSGLKQGTNYVLQYSAKDADDKRLQPDAVIYLPENKHLIIDAKVSLSAYMDYVQPDATKEAQAHALQRLKVSLENHIRQLSKKGYERIEGLDAPDYVFMFIANEPAYLLAMGQPNWQLMKFGMENKVMLVGPSTLLAVLRTVASVWQLALQQENAQEISQQGARLLDKFAGFQDSMEQLGRALGGAQKSYETARNRLYEGQGNLVQQAEKLKELGVKGKKALKNGQDTGL